MDEGFQKHCQCGYRDTGDFEMCDKGTERVTWMRENPRATQYEEDRAPGCPWAMDTLPEFGNCWWKFMAESGVIGNGCSEEFISKSLHISIRQVRESIATAKKKMMTHQTMIELRDLCRSGDLFPDSHADDGELDFYTPTNFSFVDYSSKTTGSGEDDGVVPAETGNNGRRIVKRGPKITPLVPSPDF
jgi:hypothetical protein